MVTEDLDNKNSNEKFKPSDGLYFADPLDRLAAAVIDVFIVLAPIMMLMISPLRLWIFKSVLLDDEVLFSFLGFITFLVVLLFVVFYQATMTYYFGATLGKKLMGLKVINVWSKKTPNWSTSILRSCFWILGVLALGFPFLSILFNIRRRSIHDRVSETIVVSENYKGVASPSQVESSVAKGILVGFLAFVSLLFVVTVYSTYLQISNGDHILSLLESNGYLCEAVTQAKDEWPYEKSEPASRESVAMALYAAGAIDKIDCLEPEVELSFQQQRATQISYLAKSFVYSDRLKLSDSYLEKVCQLDEESEHCLMSQIVDHWSQEDWSKVNELFAQVDDSSYVYLKVWKVRHLMKVGDFLEAQEWLGKLPEVSGLSDFKIKYKTKNYWGLQEYDMAKAAFSVAAESLSEYEKFHLASWLCYQQSANNCSSQESLSCQVMNQGLDEDPTLYKVDEAALADMRQSHCQNKRFFAEDFVSGEVAKLARAYNKVLDSREKSIDMFWGLLNNTKLSEKVRSEASRYYAEYAQTNEELMRLVMHWKVVLNNLEWQKTGVTIFKKLMQVNEYNAAVEVAAKLKEYSYLDEDVLKDYVVALYHSGQGAEAWRELANHKKFSNPSRMPASSDQFEQVQFNLQKEFLNK